MKPDRARAERAAYIRRERVHAHRPRQDLRAPLAVVLQPNVACVALVVHPAHVLAPLHAVEVGGVVYGRSDKFLGEEVRDRRLADEREGEGATCDVQNSFSNSSSSKCEGHCPMRATPQGAGLSKAYATASHICLKPPRDKVERARGRTVWRPTASASQRWIVGCG